MTRQKWTSIIMFFIFLFTSQMSVGSAVDTNRSIKRNVAAVLFASLGGAILGLSTLSFYGEPQEHTDNITLGALLGFTAGVGYLIYDSSHTGSPNYGYSQIFDLDQNSRRALAFTKMPPAIQFVYGF